MPEEKKEKLTKEEKEKEKEEREKKEQLEKKAREESKKMEKRVKNTLIIILIILVALIFSFVFKDQITDTVKEIVGTRFTYNNFKFEKFYFGEIPMYKTEIFIPRGDQIIKYDLVLRNDPRELEEKINLLLTNKKIRLKSFFSLAPETDDCETTILAAWNIGQFLGALGINNAGATTDINTLKNSSYENDSSRVKTCKDTDDATVIILTKSKTNNTNSSSSFISHEYQGIESEDCFVLNYNNCNNTIAVSERFMLMIITELNKR